MALHTLQQAPVGLAITVETMSRSPANIADGFAGRQRSAAAYGNKLRELLATPNLPPIPPELQTHRFRSGLRQELQMVLLRDEFTSLAQAIEAAAGAEHALKLVHKHPARPDSGRGKEQGKPDQPAQRDGKPKDKGKRDQPAKGDDKPRSRAEQSQTWRTEAKPDSDSAKGKRDPPSPWPGCGGDHWKVDCPAAKPQAEN